MDECRSCHAEIEWTVTEAGKSMPVNAGEHTDGNVAVAFPSSGRGASRSRHLKHGEDLRDGERRTVSHYATCPDGKAWRERGRG